METVAITEDPTLPLGVDIDFKALAVAAYKCLYKVPGADWVTFADGTDDTTAPATHHHYDIGPLPVGTLLYYILTFNSTKPGTAYSGSIVHSQSSEPLDPPLPFEGRTDEDGIAIERRQAVLQ